MIRDEVDQSTCTNTKKTSERQGTKMAFDTGGVSSTFIGIRAIEIILQPNVDIFSQLVNGLNHVASVEMGKEREEI
jgi:hypothetical protein